MGRKDREITDIDQIEDIIGRALRCCIGMVDGTEPYVVPVSFGYERNALYFHSALEGRKVDVIRKNNRLSFEIDTDLAVVRTETGCGWSMEYRSVMGTGTAHILETDGEKAHGLGVITRHYAGDDFRLPEPIPTAVLVVRVDIESISGKSTY